MASDRGLSLATLLKQEMVRKRVRLAWAGDPDLCLAVYSARGGPVIHPLNRIRSVIAAARRSKDFKLEGYIRAMDSAGMREVLHPAFVLVDSSYLDGTDRQGRGINEAQIGDVVGGSGRT